MTDLPPTGQADPGSKPVEGGAGLAAAGIGLSRLSGLFRALLVTNVLGVGAVGDAFAAALRIPNLLQNLFGEGALSAAFVPSYAKLVEKDRAAAGQLAAAVASFLFAVVTVSVLVGVVAARPITRLIAWGFEGERFELAVKLVRITAIGAGVLVIGAWCVCILNAHRRFFISYVAPVIWNVAQISVLVFLVLFGTAGQDRATALAWAVTAGAVAQVLFSLAAVRRANGSIFELSGSGLSGRRGSAGSGLSGRANRTSIWQYLSWRQESVRVVLRRFAPAIAGRGAFQISAFADLALASLLAVGATAALAAAQALYLLPVALLGVAVAAAELPAISRLTDATEIAERTAERLKSTAYLVGGIVAIYLAAGVPLADTLFNLAGLRNTVGIDDITLIAFILGAYSLGLPAIVASRLCQNVLFAAGDTRSPARFAVVRLSFSAAIGALVMFPLDRLLVVNGSVTGFSTSNDFGFFNMLSDAVRLNPALPARLGAVGLALGASVGAWVELYLLRQEVLAHNQRRAVADSVGSVGVDEADGAAGGGGSADDSADGANVSGTADARAASSRLVATGLMRHIWPSIAALIAGVITAWALSQFGDPPAIVRLAFIAAIAGGVHLAVGLTLKLAPARQLASQPFALMRRSRSNS